MFNPNLRPDTPVGEKLLKERMQAVQNDFETLPNSEETFRRRLSKKALLAVMILVILFMVISQQPQVYGLENENSTPLLAKDFSAC